jgi:hypothetical protein
VHTEVSDRSCSRREDVITAADHDAPEALRHPFRRRAGER